LFCHIVAVLHSRKYRTENAGALRQDWPRIPMPIGAQSLHSSGSIGDQVGKLLDLTFHLDGVSTGEIRQELAKLGLPFRTDGRSINPASGDLQVAAGWGYLGKDGITMPGGGKATLRDYTAEERKALREGGKSFGLSLEQVCDLVGSQTCDIQMNEKVLWKNVPHKVWKYSIGGYPAIKKWLSYREYAVLGRSLSSPEARQFSEIVRRIAALLLLEPSLDRNYESLKLGIKDWEAKEPPVDTSTSADEQTARPRALTGF